MASARNFEKALSVLNAELASIARLYRAPQYAFMRDMKKKGQLDVDYQRLEGKIQDLRAVLPTVKLVEFDACVQQLAMAFGEMIIHASLSYDDQLNVMQGWSQTWQKLDNAIKGVNSFLGRLADEEGETGQARGAGGPRVDLFRIDRGCA